MREISSAKQKILIIGIIGIIIVVAGMIALMFMGGKNNKQTVDNSTEKTLDNNQSVDDQNKKDDAVNVTEGDKKFLKIATNNVYGLKMKKGTNQVMFFQEQKILAADPFSGKKSAVSSYPFLDVTKFLWTKNSDKIIVKDTEGYYIYEVNSNLAYQFKEAVDIAIWDDKGDKIVYKYYDVNDNKRKIAVAGADSNSKKLVVEGIPYRKVDLTVQPNTENICYFPHPDARVKGKLFCKSLNGEIKKEYGGQYGQDYLWSPDGSKILTSFTKEESGNKLVLGVMSKTGGEAKGLSLGTTIKKCVWSKNNIDVYCAVLGGAPLAIMLPNAWDEQLFNSGDTFWKINTNTGEKSRLIGLKEMDFVIDSESLTLDAEENFLFFISRRDRSLWRLKL
jgi:hypothetical protein